jgi:hypothetical protein
LDEIDLQDMPSESRRAIAKLPGGPLLGIVRVVALLVFLNLLLSAEQWLRVQLPGFPEWSIRVGLVIGTFTALLLLLGLIAAVVEGLKSLGESLSSAWRRIKGS